MKLAKFTLLMMIYLQRLVITKQAFIFALLEKTLNLKILHLNYESEQNVKTA